MVKTIIKTRHSIYHYLLNIFLYLIKLIFNSLIWISLGLVGLVIFQSKQSPFDKIFGIPLILVGFGLTINGMQSLILSILSTKFNQGICRWCSK